MQSNKCDFCGIVPVESGWLYPCQDFTAAGLLLDESKKHVIGPTQELLNSDNDWLACERCSNFIDRNKIIELADIVAPSAHHSELVESITTLWNAFLHFRTGPKRRFHSSLTQT